MFGCDRCQHAHRGHPQQSAPVTERRQITRNQRFRPAHLFQRRGGWCRVPPFVARGAVSIRLPSAAKSGSGASVIASGVTAVSAAGSSQADAAAAEREEKRGGPRRPAAGRLPKSFQSGSNAEACGSFCNTFHCGRLGGADCLTAGSRPERKPASASSGLSLSDRDAEAIATTVVHKASACSTSRRQLRPVVPAAARWGHERGGAGRGFVRLSGRAVGRRARRAGPGRPRPQQCLPPGATRA